MKWFSWLLTAFLFCISGCELGTRNKELQLKETALNKKEQELLLKENALRLREKELQKKEVKFDSSLKKDTVQLVSPALIGTWAVKMTCTETTCTGSAVGDVKNEQWIISYEGSTIIAKAMAGNQLARMYTGFYTGTTVELVEDRIGTASQPASIMVVRLRIIDESNMEGQREIVRDKECKVIYALQMKKQ